MLYSLSLDYLTTLELDVYVTADKQLILSHDAYLNPSFVLNPDGTEIDKADNKKYPLHQMNYDEIKEFDVGSKVHEGFPEQKKMKVSIPLLGDVIDSVQHYIKTHKRAQVFYNIETKSSEDKDNVLNAAPEEFVKLLMDVVEKKGITPYVIVQSFDVRTLQILNEKYPYVRTSYLVGPARQKEFTIEEELEVLGFDPDIYSPHFKYITKEQIEKCHERGIKVVVYTPNTKEEIDELKAMGVDGIITDYPELLAE
jgi:glycerophosphoryl diester phosphodiesterase